MRKSGGKNVRYGVGRLRKKFTSRFVCESADFQFCQYRQIFVYFACDSNHDGRRQHSDVVYDAYQNGDSFAAYADIFVGNGICNGRMAGNDFRDNYTVTWLRVVYDRTKGDACV